MLKLSRYLTLVFTACCSASVLFSNTVHAQQAPQGFLYGLGVGVNQEIYQGYKRRVIPLPLLGYRGEKLSVYGPFVSYTFSEQGPVRINAKLAPRFAGFDERDSDMFIGMAKRKNSLDGGIGLQWRQHNWVVEADTMLDLLGNAKGQESKLSLAYNWRIGPVLLEPKVGISYADSNLVDYYYGVRPNEANTFRSAYQAGSAFNYHAGVAVSNPLFGGLTRLGLEHHWYDSSISQSPLTDRDGGWSVFFAWSRFF